MLIMPLMLTVVSVQAQNQKEMKGSNIKAQELVLTQEWDKTFPQSNKVNHRKVTFVNRYGITRTLVISALCLIIIVIILHKLRCIGWQRIDHATALFIITLGVLFGTLCIELLAFLVTGVFIVVGIKIAICIYAVHVVHWQPLQ